MFTYDHHDVVTRRIDEITGVLEQINIWMSENRDEIDLTLEEGEEIRPSTLAERRLLESARRDVSELLHKYVEK